MRGVVCPSLTWNSCSAVCYAPGMGGVKKEKGGEGKKEEKKRGGGGRKKKKRGAGKKGEKVGGRGRKEKRLGGGEERRKRRGKEEEKEGGGKEYCAYERKYWDGLPIRRAQRAITLGDRVEKE